MSRNNTLSKTPSTRLRSGSTSATRKRCQNKTGKKIEMDVLTAWSRKEFTMTDVCVRAVGERISHLRSMVGLTLDEASRISEISKTELCRLENGNRKINEIHIARLAKLFRMTTNDLTEILNYKIENSVRYTPEEIRHAARHSLKLTLFTPEGLRTRHMRIRERRREIDMQFTETVSNKAYAVQIGVLDNLWMPPHSILVIDPEKIVRVGELVLNTISYDPLVINLERANNMKLRGRFNDAIVDFPANVTVRNFHKIIAILPSPDGSVPCTDLPENGPLS